MFGRRKLYYDLVCRLSDIELLATLHGFGLYDRRVDRHALAHRRPLSVLPRPRLATSGSTRQVEFMQPARKRGITKNNFYTLYDMAMLGITSHSKVPLRVATMLGFAMSGLSLLVAFGYLVPSCSSGTSSRWAWRPW